MPAALCLAHFSAFLHGSQQKRCAGLAASYSFVHHSQHLIVRAFVGVLIARRLLPALVLQVSEQYVAGAKPILVM